MSQNFAAGDFLIFQIESAYGLLRILDIENDGGETIWHLSAYNEMFLEIDSADKSLENYKDLTLSIPHVALTNRAFEATQVARMKNEPLSAVDLRPYEEWKASENREVYDRSIRLMLGLR